MDDTETAEQVADYLAGLTDAELLELLNGELARRTTVDPEEQAAAEKAKADDAEFAKYYPASGKR
jgi:membrane peptidoglycan carboxypeptidase